MTKGADVRVLGRDVFRDSPPVGPFIDPTLSPLFNDMVRESRIWALNGSDDP
jgi:hypothetical protein